MTLQDRKDLVAKPFWNYRDIMEYTGFKKDKAISIFKKCIKEYEGSIKYEPSYITCESFFKYYGTTRTKELAILKGLSNEKKV